MASVVMDNAGKDQTGIGFFYFGKQLLSTEHYGAVSLKGS